MKKFLLLTTILTNIFLFNGCKKNEKDEIIYNAIKVSLVSRSGHIDVNGTVEAKDTIDVFVDKKLKVKEVFVQEGDFVEKGQLLMRFDETSRNTIKRNLEKEKLNLTKLKREYLIEKELYKIGGSPINTVKEYEENIRISELTIEEYEEDLAKTAEKILSPVSGTITALHAQENYSVNTDDPLLELEDLSDIKIILEIPEYNVKDVALNQMLIIKPEVYEKKKSFPGKIVKISRVSKVSSTTGENIVEVEVKPDESIPYIVPGFDIIARIYIGEKTPGIYVPSTAVLNSEDKYFVFVSDEKGNIKKTYVTISPLKGNIIEIKSGLSEGDILIINPNQKLSDGSNIKIILEEESTRSKRKGRKP